MKINAVGKDGLAILSLAGKLDFSNGAELKTAIEKQLSAAVSEFIIDLREVSYIDSSGIATLVSSFTTVRKEGGNLKLTNLSEAVEEMLKLTEIIEIFEVYDT